MRPGLRRQSCRFQPPGQAADEQELNNQCGGGNWTDVGTDEACNGPEEVGSGEVTIGGACLRRGAYCRPGHYGPLCNGCVEDGTFFDEAERRCTPCAKRSGGLVIAAALVAAVLLAVLSCFGYQHLHRRARDGAITHRIRKMAARGMMRAKLLARNTEFFIRLKIMVGFYQVVGVLKSTYGVDLPPEYDAYPQAV